MKRSLNSEESAKIAAIYQNSIGQFRRQFRGRDREMAEDVIHDVFEEVERNVEKVLAMDNPCGWIAFLCKRRLINKIRRERRYTAFDERSTLAGGGETMLSQHQLEFLQAMVLAFEKVLQECRPVQREVVRRRIADEKTFKIIGAELGMPTATAATCWRRFVKNLEEEIC